MAKKGTVAHRSEYVTVIYGIHAATKSVRSIYVQRDGKMIGSTSDGGSYTHHVGPGRRDETEAVIVFGLSDVFSVPIAISDSENTKKRVEELRAKALGEAG